MKKKKFTLREGALIVEVNSLRHERNVLKKDIKKLQRQANKVKTAHRSRVFLTHRQERYIRHLEQKLELTELKNPGTLSKVDKLLKSHNALEQFSKVETQVVGR